MRLLIKVWAIVNLVVLGLIIYDMTFWYLHEDNCKVLRALVCNFNP